MALKERVHPTAPCGRCGATTDLEVHGHWICFPCARSWSMWLAGHASLLPVSERASTLRERWLATYAHFLAASRGNVAAVGA